LKGQSRFKNHTVAVKWIFNFSYYSNLEWKSGFPVENCVEKFCIPLVWKGISIVSGAA